ncbi:MAG: hypothetical protein QGD93_11705 [Actinomycetota bacterium]|nr:hypothetical protein [Actinomycetota bacterium]
MARTPELEAALTTIAEERIKDDAVAIINATFKEEVAAANTIRDAAVVTAKATAATARAELEK